VSLEPLYVVDAFHRREYPGLRVVAAASSGVEVADDFAQWRRVSVLERPGRWCYRVLINVCRRWYRRRRTEARHWSRRRAVAPVVGGPSGRAARRLPVRPRSAVVLISSGGRPAAEVRARVVMAAELRL
jgi:hypothetical protein